MKKLKQLTRMYRKLRLAMLGSCVLLGYSSYGQSRIAGRVTDENDEGLPGVTILIKGTSNGTISDIDGSYSIDALPTDVMVFSFIGFVSQEVTVGDQSTLDIVMKIDIQSLEEVVVTGYGQGEKITTISTAVQKLEAKTLVEDRPVQRVEQVLQGATPAVVVIKESGSPGAPLTVRMRGISTAGNASPLVMVNGVQVPDMNFINPNDIADITVLKDAASSAIYGARGGNGVILLETRKGGEGDPKINLSTYYGVQSLAHDGDYLDSKGYAKYYNNSVNYLIRQGQSIPGRGKFTDEELAVLPNTSWIEEVSQNAPISDIQLNVTGGNAQSSYYLGLGRFDQGGIIGTTDFSRTSVSIGLNSKVKERVDVSFFGTFTDNNRRFMAENSENSRLMSSVSSLPPIYPVYAESGSPFNNGLFAGVEYMGIPLNSQAEFGNPVLGLEHSENHSNSSILYGNALVSWEFIKNFKLNTSGGYMLDNTIVRQFSERFDYPDQQFTNPINTLGETFIKNLYSQWEAYLSYDLSLRDEHNASVIAGTSLIHNEFNQRGRFGLNFFANNIDDANFANIQDDGDEFIPNDNIVINTTQSVYGRLLYNYKEKYLFSGTLRADASSKFGPDYRWGYFPSVSLGWVLSSEDFLINNNWVDLLKIRASYGVNGNDFIPSYQYYARYQRSEGGTFFAQDVNEDVKWEEITQFNVGIDANLAQSRLGLSMDYYIKETSDMLLAFPNPGYVGKPAPIRNAATVVNRGLEFLALWRDDINGEIRYNINFNIGFNTNEVTDLGGGLPIEGASTRVFKDAPNLSRTDTGHPIASFYGLKFTGLDEAGNPEYKDFDGDGEITYSGDRTYIGNPYPDFIMGLNLNASYKGFDINFQVFGSYGNDLVNAAMGYGFQYGNRTERSLKGWSAENPNSNIMRPSALEVVNHEFSDYYIEDGSYTRIRNITLGYTLPEGVLAKMKVDNLRVFVSGNNLWTFTEYSGYDPEIGSNISPLDVGIDRGFYPLPKSFMGGFQLSF